MTELDAQDKRIDDILDNTNGETFEDCIDRFYTHLTGAVKLACDVTGIEDQLVGVRCEFSSPMTSRRKGNLPQR